jgi:hypothetical protein
VDLGEEAVLTEAAAKVVVAEGIRAELAPVARAVAAAAEVRFHRGLHSLVQPMPAMDMSS